MQLLYDQGGPVNIPGAPPGELRMQKPYWYARTDDGGYDGDGPTPLDAITALALELEAVLVDKNK